MPPGMAMLSDAEIEADLDATLTRRAPGEDVWLFGYGSLMWNPAIEFSERRGGVVHGWHRRFCLWLHGGRGSPDNPGLMLALERGGRCAGMLFRIPAPDARAELLLAWRRERFTDAYHSRWVTAMTSDGPVRAVTFVANRAHLRYAGRLDEAVVAARLASANGVLGSCAAYLAACRGLYSPVIIVGVFAFAGTTAPDAEQDSTSRSDFARQDSDAWFAARKHAETGSRMA